MATIEYTNQPKIFSLQDFRGISNQFGGLAKASRFIVTFNLKGQLVSGYAPMARDLTYLCEVAEMPGRGFLSIDGIRYYGPTFQLPFVTEYTDISLTFLCRNKQYERQFFDNWMTLINPPNTYDFNYRDDYSADINIWHLTDVGEDFAKAEYNITIEDAYPTLVNPQSATWVDDNFQRLSVNFTYFRWIRKGLDPEARDQTNAAGYNYDLVIGASEDRNGRNT